MRVEILFKDSSTPKVHTDAVAVYTKPQLLAIELESGMVVKYPLQNIWSICHMHGPHAGTTKNYVQAGKSRH